MSYPNYKSLQATTIIMVFMWMLILAPSGYAQDWVYTTTDGDNLWDFSEKHLDKVMRFKQLKKINNIKNPNHLRPGTQLRIPLKWVRSNPATAKILATQGVAHLIHKDGTSTQLTPESAKEQQISLGDRIQTGDDSSVAITFADKTTLTLNANSLIRFDHLSAYGSTGMVDSRLHLLKGRLKTKVTKAVGAGSRFEIHTPSAISAVRGTEYRASADEQSQTSRIEVLEGLVDVDAAKKRRGIHDGFGTMVEKGKPPTEPRQLLNAPELNEIPESIRTLNWDFSWQAINDAHAYRIEISENAEFNTILWQKVTENSHINLPDLEDGDYSIRLKGIDSIGLEGIPGVAAITIDTDPQPPVLNKPVADQIFKGKTVVLQWSKAELADYYQLQLAEDTDFSKLLLEQDVKQESFDTSLLLKDQKTKKQRYCWRLISVAADGEKGPASETRCYDFISMPEKIKVQMIMGGDDILRASWMSAPADLSFHVQIAEDSDFKNLLIDEVTKLPYMHFKPTPAKYIRVQGIDADNIRGPWSDSQQIAPSAD